jgi:tetratricopeptide (TPR) repeat protein
MIEQVEIHKFTSEYKEAHKICIQILQEASPTQKPYIYALALANAAEIEVSMGTPKNDVLEKVDTARQFFTKLRCAREVIFCDAVLADLHLREGNILAAKSLLQTCIKISMGKAIHIACYCLEQLSDVSRWTSIDSSPAIVFLVYSVKLQEKLGIHKALQFLGDLFIIWDDEETAIILYTLALTGFTELDVHRSRGECMLRLGDISKRHSDLLKAVEHWETARVLFERSSQTKQVQNIDERLASVGEDVREQYRKTLAC